MLPDAAMNNNDDVCTNCNNNNNNNNNSINNIDININNRIKCRIFVDEDEPEIDVDETPFDARCVSIRRDKRFTDEFEVVDFLGRGRFGEVKRCRELTSGREFAAKFIVTPKPKDRDDVTHEVNIMRKLQNCRRLVQLYDVFETKKDMCLVLEIIYGGELFDRAVSDDFVLTEKACVCFVRQICEGIAFMHSKNIVHLDMKPENILCLSRTGNRIKIIDFGLAREYEPSVETRVMYGTPEFMAPEVVQFDPIDFATDMWSIGVICYVLLSGLSPFMGDSDTETMTNVSKGHFEFHSPEFDDISTDAKDLIASLLQADKRKRLTADDCLKHQWLRPKGAPQTTSPSLTLSKEHLKRFVYRRKWQKAVHAILALKRMGVDLKSLKSSVAAPCLTVASSSPVLTTLDSCSDVTSGRPTDVVTTKPLAVPPSRPQRRHRSAGNVHVTSLGAAANNVDHSENQLQQRPLSAGDKSKIPPLTEQTGIITHNATDASTVDKETGSGSGNKLNSSSSDISMPVATEQRARLALVQSSTHNCRCANGLRLDAPPPPPPLPPRSGLHRRLNVVVRDRIIFFSKKDQATGARKAKCSHSNS